MGLRPLPVEISPNLKTIERALGLIGPNALGNDHSIVTTFGCLATEFRVRSGILKDQNSAHAQRLARLSHIASHYEIRRMDLFSRLTIISHMRGRFSELTGEAAYGWHTLAALLIKDFNGDVSSLMDSLAAVLIEVTVGLKTSDPDWVPGFSILNSKSAHIFRKTLPASIRDCVDSTERWWPGVKALRDMLTHRNHDKIVFGNAREGIHFQFYDPKSKALVIHPAFLVPNTHLVADFEAYAASTLAEVLVFMDDLGRELTACMGWTADSLTRSMLVGDFSSLVHSLDELRRPPVQADPKSPQ